MKYELIVEWFQVFCIYSLFLFIRFSVCHQELRSVYLNSYLCHAVFFPFFMWKGWVFTMNREFEIPTNFNRTVTHNFRSTDRLYLFWVLFAPWNWFENSSGLINWTKRKETEKTLCFCTVLRFDVEFILRDQMVCVKHNS